MKTLASLALLMTLAACSSAPRIRYYTLVQPIEVSQLPSGFAGVDLVSVRVPAQVDHPQLVLRQGAERVELIESQRWIAALPDEIRSGLASRLDVRVPAATQRLRLAVEITRFESVLDRYTLVEAHWQLRGKTGEPLNCSTRALQKVDGGFEALVAGHQRGLDQLADAIAAGARQVHAAAPTCPA